MQTLKLLLPFCLTTLLSACNTTSYDKATIYYDRAQFPSQIVKDVPDLNTPITQHGRCSVIVSTPGSTTGPYYFCTYALTATGLYVQGWDAKQMKYTEIARVDLAALRTVSLYSFLKNKQVQLTEERRQLALSAMIDEGGYIDGEATVRLFEAIRSKGVKVVENDGAVKPPAPAGPVYVPLIIPQVKR
ncbi:hypothetical protein [Pseudomonas lijiangensis]|uniref:Lipoprotein n=1 Tax=Pseudomonas lijiangensis TaxID=2995658 RepID=A0ABX8HZT5_9PSED|nr:hypothetical protein [Pseudomonas lijiangensis]MBX8502723.1 hypothetical protein [Pseudomonas lijiangensis]MBX8507670.1 hypothetical protein [Pseudomonas lijiangensis]QWU84746.1 hypothetical protein KQP88_08290 [Pseudomonas lijiangensis]